MLKEIPYDYDIETTYSRMNEGIDLGISHLNSEIKSN